MRSVRIALLMLSAFSLARPAGADDKEFVYAGTVVYDSTGEPAAGVTVTIERWRHRWGALFRAPLRFLEDPVSG